MFRAFVAAIALTAIATPALALQREDVVGAWETRWANAQGEAPEGGGALILSRDTSEEGLDGLSPAPGWDGVMTGEVATRADGVLVWNGRWASIWPEGATMGTFQIVFTDANTFNGTWSSDDGEIVNAAWSGQRAR